MFLRFPGGKNMPVVNGEVVLGNRAVSKIGALLVLLFLQLYAGKCEAFEVDPLEKTYDIRILFSKNTIKGRYYRPEPDMGKPLLVLIHGATYGRWMWDVPGYSWIDFFVVQLGYPVLAIDRLGYGASSHPNGNILTPRCQVQSLKQVLVKVKQESGQRRIIVIGHSMGGLLGNMIAGETRLLDGLITIGWLHGEKETQIGPPFSSILKNSYVTWKDAEREAAFYNVHDADRKIVAHDNSRSYPMPRGSTFSFFSPDRFVLSQINIPVLLVAGEKDALWADIDLEAESSLFEKTRVATYVQKNAGHTCMLHRSYRSLLDTISNWLEENF